MFKEERSESAFTWNMIGNIKEGRPNLGPLMDVSVYRLMQFTLRDTIIAKYTVKEADEIFFAAGKKAGEEFYMNILKNKENLNGFIKELQQILKDLGIGILRVEESDIENKNFIITVAEDLDCSGLPLSGENVCTYDEGFINGLLSSHLNIQFEVKEIDCWASGERVCRFKATAVR